MTSDSNIHAEGPVGQAEPLPIYTVVGYFEEDGNTFADIVSAMDGMHAMVKVARDRENCTLVLAILGAHHETVTTKDGDPGTLTFSGESVVDAETFLDAFGEEYEEGAAHG